MCPEYSFCRIYNSGKVIFGKGRLDIKEENPFKSSKKISPDYVQKIAEIVSKYSDLLYINENAIPEIIRVTDSSTTTVHISNGEISNTLSVYALECYSRDFVSGSSMGYKLAKLTEEVRDILVKAGIGEEYC